MVRKSDWTTNVVFQLQHGLKLGPNGSSTTHRSRQILLRQSWTVLVGTSGIFLGHKKAHNNNPTNTSANFAGNGQSLDPSMALGCFSRTLWTNPEPGLGSLDLILLESMINLGQNAHIGLQMTAIMLNAAVVSLKWWLCTAEPRGFHLAVPLGFRFAEPSPNWWEGDNCCYSSLANWGFRFEEPSPHSRGLRFADPPLLGSRRD